MILVAAAVSSLFLAAAVLAATFVLLKHQSVAVLRKLPGPKPNFLFGNALQLARLPDGKYKPILHLKTKCKLARRMYRDDCDRPQKIELLCFSL